MPKISKTELIKLQKSLKTDAAIGEKFGVTRQAIHQLRVKFGIPSNLVKNDERNAKIVELYKKGLTGTEIAKKLDLSISQTYRMINLAEKKTPAKKKKK
jgi:DNA invertase Pin-like site-specific DNA recombinase